jgi:hypothetical protein
MRGCNAIGNVKRDHGHGPKSSASLAVSYTYQDIPISGCLNRDLDVEHVTLKSGLIALMSDNTSGVQVCDAIKLFISYVNDNASVYAVGADHKHDV